MKGMGFSFNNPREIAAAVRSPERMSKILNQDRDGDDSAAKIFADIINSQRADNARLAQEHGVSIQPKRMTPDRAAQVLAGILHNGGVELVEMFNDEAAHRDSVLRSALDEDEYEAFTEAKLASMFTADPLSYDEWAEQREAEE